jgi:hypothetical protein
MLVFEHNINDCCGNNELEFRISIWITKIVVFLVSFSWGKPKHLPKLTYICD